MGRRVKASMPSQTSRLALPARNNVAKAPATKIQPAKNHNPLSNDPDRVFNSPTIFGPKKPPKFPTELMSPTAKAAEDAVRVEVG